MRWWESLGDSVQSWTDGARDWWARYRKPPASKVSPEDITRTVAKDQKQRLRDFIVTAERHIAGDIDDDEDLDSLDEIKRHIFSSVEHLYCHGGGSKGRVLPRVIGALREEFGLPETKDLKGIHGLSVGNFMALALAMHLPHEKMRQILIDMPTDSFKETTLGRIINFILTVLGYFFKGLASRRDNLDSSLCDNRKMREYFRYMMMMHAEDHTGLDDADKEWLNAEKRYWIDTDPRKSPKDPTFRELYDKTKVPLYVHITVANSNQTDIYSYKNTPDVKVSRVFMTGASIPLVYAPTPLSNGCYGWDAGVSDSTHDAKHIPWFRRLHLRLLDAKGGERVYFRRGDQKPLPHINDFIDMLLEVMYNANFLEFPDEERRCSLGLVVPANTMKYTWSPKEQKAHEESALKIMRIQIHAVALMMREELRSRKAELLANTAQEQVHILGFKSKDEADRFVAAAQRDRYYKNIVCSVDEKIAYAPHRVSFLYEKPPDQESVFLTRQLLRFSKWSRDKRGSGATPVPAQPVTPVPKVF